MPTTNILEPLKPGYPLEGKGFEAWVLSRQVR